MSGDIGKLGAWDNSDEVNEDYRRKQADLLATALADNTIDDLTKSELKEGKYHHFGNLERAYDAAKAGKDFYGKRRANLEIARTIADRPGSSQTNIAVMGKPVGDTAMAGLPSMLPNVDPLATASLIQDVQRRELKKREKAGK